MKNSKVQLTDLKESNMNQLVANEMFMIRGGGGRKGCGKSNKGGGKSNKGGGGGKSKKGRGWYPGCGW